MTLGMRIKKVFVRDWQYYVLCLPVLVYVLVFEYGPMYGIQIAFKDFVASKGIWGSDWVGFKHFIRFYNSPYFWQVIKNTLSINIYSLIAGFPISVTIALLLNQTRNLQFKKIVQTTLYAPHFISVVVLCGMITLFLSPTTGIVNYFLESVGNEKIFFLSKPTMFQHIFVWSGIWQNTGWGTIIYIAALSGVNVELYESAKIDGASKKNIIWHIDIPSILPTIIMMLILNMGSLMSLGFQKIFLLQNAYNHETSEVISTYVYKMGLLGSRPQFSYSTAISLFNTVINVILLLSANKIAKKLGETSLF